MNLAIIVLSIAAAGMWLAWSFERQKNEILSKEIDEIEKLTSTDEKENPVEPVLTDLRLILVAKRFIHMFLEVKRLKKRAVLQKQGYRSFERRASGD